MGIMRAAPSYSLDELLRVSARLDARFHAMKGDAVVTSKEHAFRSLFRILEESGARYALIGGLAVQLWGEEARTTLDIDVAVEDYGSIPRPALEAAGFRLIGRHEHSENWTGPEDTPVQFSDDPAFSPLIGGAVPRTFEGGIVRVAPATSSSGPSCARPGTGPGDLRSGCGSLPTPRRSSSGIPTSSESCRTRSALFSGDPSERHSACCSTPR